MSAAIQGRAPLAVDNELLRAASSNLTERFTEEPIRVEFVSGEGRTAKAYQAFLGGFSSDDGPALCLEVFDASGEHSVCWSRWLYLHNPAAHFGRLLSDADDRAQVNGRALKPCPLQALLTEAAGHVLVHLEALRIRVKFDGGAVAARLCDLEEDAHGVDGHSDFTAVLQVDVSTRSVQLRVFDDDQPGLEFCAGLLQRVDMLKLNRAPLWPADEQPAAPVLPGCGGFD